MKYLMLLLALAATPAAAQIAVEDAWIRATPPGARTAAGYLVISADTADRLVSVTSPAAERVETHVTVHEGDVARMREVKGYDVPAHGTLELKPGGAHLMFVNIKAPMKEGMSVPATLKFQHLGNFRVDFQVRPLAGAEHHRGEHDEH
ncbi:MAG TPA: copper chaperone PCu(A)C [Burkholderiales bacterium]|nr:copper chaperone PCu(A)C [Burkholderiales bacterium]